MLFRIAIFDLALNQDSLSPLLNLLEVILSFKPKLYEVGGCGFEDLEIYCQEMTTENKISLEEPANLLIISVQIHLSKIYYINNQSSRKSMGWFKGTRFVEHRSSEIELEAILNKPCNSTFTKAVNSLANQIQKLSRNEIKKQDIEHWTRQFRELLVDYRNIGHNWQLSEEEHSLLGKYRGACYLILGCLNSDAYIRPFA